MLLQVMVGEPRWRLPFPLYSNMIEILKCIMWLEFFIVIQIFITVVIMTTYKILRK